MTHESFTRREFLVGWAIGAATLGFTAAPVSAADGKKFTILHTNDLHSNLLGMRPAVD
ncbi:MAG: twin-arginine translocation signal domain-containing protein [Planctomycetes bacterium]|nr:twin-arginine translocation signal domain-containing protein [Planctomycetota bacterium]